MSCVGKIMIFLRIKSCAFCAKLPLRKVSIYDIINI